MTIITIIVYNGLCNRLLPLISIIRLARKSNRTINMLWAYTPVRSCISYYGEFCKFEDLYESIHDLTIAKTINQDILYNFKYAETKEYVIDTSNPGNIQVNYSLYTIISKDDPNDSIFKDIKSIIEHPGEIIFDNVGIELSSIIKEFRPLPELQQEIDKYSQKFAKNMLGIHIRKSDGGFTHLKWPEITKKLIKLCEQWCAKNKDNGVFLTTDAGDVYIDFVIKLKDRLCFYTPPKTLCGMQSKDKFVNDKFNVLCAVVDLHLLGKCNKYIIGTCESTFSLCGMLLSDKDTKKYIINNPENIPNILF